MGGGSPTPPAPKSQQEIAQENLEAQIATAVSGTFICIPIGADVTCLPLPVLG